MDSADRADFLAGLKPGGKYEGIVGFYRHNVSSAQIGNGAGYDQIDV